MALAPIALFAYNRPDHLRATLVALAANTLASASDLVIFSDGPKDDLAVQSVAAVRVIARDVSGFASVKVIERAENVGLVGSITEGVGRLAAEHGRVIVLEDDLITAPRFLEFMNQALDFYEQDERVMQISGYMFPIAPQDTACFLPAVSCWGWATWQRAWQAYDPSMRGLDQLIADPVKCRSFNLDGAYDYLRMLIDHRKGRLNSWGVIWHLSIFMRDGLILYPPASMVSNVGFDGSGTHGQPNDLGNVPLVELDGELAMPEQVEIDQEIYTTVKQLIHGSKKGWRHWLRKLLPM